MKTISIAVSEDDYNAFRRAAKARQRSTAQLIREAMALYRTKKLEERPRLVDLPVLTAPRPLADLPSRAELYDDLFARGHE